jgi:hypothetical protein
VVTWYDQSGNNRDASQSTQGEQPQIVSSGSVITENGEPALDFEGGQWYLSTSVPQTTSDNKSVFVVFKGLINGKVHGLTEISVSPTQPDQMIRAFQTDNNTGLQTQSNSFDTVKSTAYSGSESLLAGMISSSSGGTLRLNGNAEITNSVTEDTDIDTLGIGLSRRDNSHDGSIKEVVWYFDEVAANFDAIRQNINEFYGLY